ncbi:hypothetical protein Patl1_03520 [Pistacia atlantica]|uniref:Uncharacterized protein n=1 Tax=Pistacia atlantica TaxID=434234 RepID=A0ACC1CD11_9ROSI|nr:hypothetical protein Patl1_03520 [Pistacia atlantica]
MFPISSLHFCAEHLFGMNHTLLTIDQPFVLTTKAILEELHRYGGGLVDTETKDSSAAPSDSKLGGVPSKTPADTVVASVTSVPHADVYHIGVPSQRSSIVIQRSGQRSHQKWKGPDKISRIYGDWIDDIE